MSSARAATASTGRAKAGSTRPPSKVRVGQMTYSVEFVDDLTQVEDGRRLSGCLLHEEQRIFVKTGDGPDWTRDTLLHEVLHAAFFAAGVAGGDNELAVSRLTPVLLGFLRDNPKLITYLQERS